MFYGGYGYYGSGYGYSEDMFWQLALIIIPFVLCLSAQILVKTRYRKYSKVANMRHMTGAQAADALLRARGIQGVRIQPVSGTMSDHYDPRSNTIYLSDGVYASTSVAAVGIACHEAGHACQYAEDYGPMKLRAKVIPAANIGSTIGLPLCLIGIIFSFSMLFYIGIILYAAVFIFQFATLPVEFNASKRALDTIEQYGLLSQEEFKGAKAVLGAAAMTYVASMASSLLTIIRLFLIGGRRRR